MFGLDSFKRIKGIIPHLDLPIAHMKIPLFIVLVPKIELKLLSKHLKYFFLGEGETLPVITSNKLNQFEENKLARMLREYKETIGWMIADIKRISPPTCMHMILLEEGINPTDKLKGT